MKNGRDGNIVLIGMSGPGKSTLGVLLAKALGKDFVDTDLLLQRAEHSLLQRLLEEKGIEAFLAAEEKVLLGLRAENSVIATGGSAVYSRAGMEALRAGGTVVYLRVGYERIAARLSNIRTRGIVLRAGNTLEDAYRERIPLYERYADVTLDCADEDAEQDVSRLIRLLT